MRVYTAVLILFSLTVVSCIDPAELMVNSTINILLVDGTLEPVYPYPSIRLIGAPPRPATAICVPSNSRTPYKPAGWRD